MSGRAWAMPASAHVTQQDASASVMKRVRRERSYMVPPGELRPPCGGGMWDGRQRMAVRPPSPRRPPRRGRAIVHARADRPSGRVAAQRGEIEHEDPPALRLDPSERPQEAHGLGDRLARRARPRGELLLRDRQADVDGGAVGAAEAVAQLDEPTGDAHDDVVDGVVDALTVGRAQPRGHPAEEHERDPRVVLEKRAERAAGDDERLDLVDRAHGRRARLAVDRRELAEELARSGEREDHLAPVVEHRRLDVAVAQDHDRAGVVALVEEDVAAAVAAHRAELLEGAALLALELSQEAVEHRAAPRYGAATARRPAAGSVPGNSSSVPQRVQSAS